MNIKKIDILGVPAHTINFEETVQFITDASENHKQQAYIVAQNAEKIMMARKDRELADLMNKALLLYPDGVGVSLASRILYSKPVSRVPGFNLFLELLKVASKRNMKIFLLGSRDDVINTTQNKIQKDYPGINIVGYQNGYFKSNDEVIKLINSVSPDILFVGMGSPKQERWIYRNIRCLNVRLCMGVGGSFDVIEGEAKLAPAAIRRFGFEFVYRLIKEPRRLKRQLVFPNFLFSLLATRTCLMKKNK